MENQPMTKQINALSARTRFGELMKRAAKENIRYVVSRRGKAQVVILGVEDYLKNVIKQPKLLTEIQLEAELAGKEEIADQDIQAEITSYRNTVK